MTSLVVLPQLTSPMCTADIKDELTEHFFTPEVRAKTRPLADPLIRFSGDIPWVLVYALDNGPSGAANVWIKASEAKAALASLNQEAERLLAIAAIPEPPTEEEADPWEQMCTCGVHYPCMLHG